MLESGPSGSVRGVPSNGHPYRDPGPNADIWLKAVCMFPIEIEVMPPEFGRRLKLKDTLCILDYGTELPHQSGMPFVILSG
jgi:hypothetical protein